MLASQPHLRRFIILIALLGLGLRSLIPPGYMPDFSGQGKGLLPLVVCDGFDHTAHAGHMHHPHDNKHCFSGLCPFGINALMALSQPDMGIYAHPDYAVSSAGFSLQAFVTQLAFSNVSPRSPPYLS